MIDLGEEFSTAVCNITAERLATLRAAGVPDSAFDPPMVGLAVVEVRRGGLFDIVDDRNLVAIVPAGWWDGLNWELVDLIAFHLDRPSRWWRRLGDAQILGTVPSNPVFPLRLFDTPLSWLQAGGTGACIVDWRLDPDRLLYAGAIKTETPSLKARLERRIQSAALARFNISVSEVLDAA